MSDRVSMIHNVTKDSSNKVYNNIYILLQFDNVKL